MLKTFRDVVSRILFADYGEFVQSSSLQVVSDTDIALVPERVPDVIRMDDHRLSRWLEQGRWLHPRGSGSFLGIEYASGNGYMQTRYKTCAMGAIFAGAYGKAALESGPGLDQILWQINKALGWRMDSVFVIPPISAYQQSQREIPLHKAIMSMNDGSGWTRAGTADWLDSIGL